MKNIIITLLSVFLLSPLAHAQKEKVITDNYNLPKSKVVELNLKFASDIVVKPWDKKEIAVKTIITYELDDFLSVHQKEVDETSEGLVISTDYKMPENHEKYNCWSCDEQEGYGNLECICFKTAYEIYAPKDAVLNIETISGDIELLGFDGTLNVKTISGFVDLSLKASAKTDLKFKSVTGEIYTDFSIKLDKGSSSYSKKVNTSINGGGSKISLETVSGDIYFRKI